MYERVLAVVPDHVPALCNYGNLLHKTFASFFPLKWLTQAMRYVFLPDGAQVIEASGSWDLGMCALVLGAWTIAGFLIAIKVFRWAPRGSGG